MPRPVNDILTQRLRALLLGASGLDALALVSMDGLEIASVLPPGVDPARMSAMTLAAFTLGEQIARELHRRKMGEVFIRGSQGFIVLLPVKSKAVLIALAREGARPGLVLLEMRRAVAELTHSPKSAAS